MSLFKKSNRKSHQKSNQRTRCDDSDEDNRHSSGPHLSRFEDNLKISTKLELNNENSNKSNDKFDRDLDIKSETKAKVKDIPKISFFDDEEEDCDVFKVKKSSYSRRMANQKDNQKKKKDPKKEKVKPIEDDNENGNRNRDDLNVIWIKSKEIKEEKSSPKEEIKIFAGDQIESDSEYEDEEPEEYKSNEPYHHFRGALERGVIPDAKTIYELKKQRQMARDVEELIIPLADDEDSESRVIRDDDEDRSDDDDDQRISFAINKDNIERQKAREAFLMAQEESHDVSGSESESEDELDRWEREQIKKGVRMPVIQMLNQEQATSRAISGLFNDNMNVVDMDIDRPFQRHKKSSSVPSRVLNKSKSSVTMDEMIERIRNELKIRKESFGGDERQITTLTIESDQCRQHIDKLTQKRQQLIDSYKASHQLDDTITQ